jgi:DNA-directed RNA polymerase subunit D
VNSLRRSCTDLVPSLAIEDVTITGNNSALYDEVVAHRLGLIPLKTDLKTYNYLKDCKCKGAGCARCTVTFTLSKKGPCLVYSGDMKSSDKNIVPVFGKMIIAKLFENQELEFEAKAVLGVGAVHAKWSPCLAYYKFTPRIKIDNKKVKDAQEIVDCCHKHVFIAKSKTNVEVDNKHLLDCDLCLNCVEKSEGISVESDDKDILFTIESWGQLSPKKIYNQAVDILISDLDAFKKGLK